MAVGSNHNFAIDEVPTHVRQNAIDSLLAGKSSREVAAYLLQQGHKISHAAVARYNKLVIQPALRTGAKLRQIEAPNADGALQAKATADLTREALKADPILDLWRAQQDRLHSAIGETLQAKAFDTYAKLESVAAKNYEGHAKTMQHPGFVASAPQQSAGTTVVVVMPTASDPRMQAWQQRQGAIEVKVEPTEE